MPIYMNPAQSKLGKGGSVRADLARLGISGQPGAFNGPEVVGFAMEVAVAPPEIKSRRFVSRALAPSDYAQLVRVMAENDERLAPSGQAPGADDLPADADAFATWIEQFDLLRSLDQRYEFSWFADDVLMGGTSLWGVVRSTAQSAFLGGWVASSHAGQNAGGELFVATCQFGFEKLGLHRLEMPTLLDNALITRLLVGLGIRDEGVTERFLQVNGEWRDHRRYVITAEEWQARREELLGA